MQENEKKPVIIAMVGKGGVGKTSISAITVRILAQKFPDKRILAIDADPAIGLSTALGVDVSTTVDDIRKAFVEGVEAGEQKAAIEMLGEAKYRIFDCLVEKENVSFLAIGRPEAAGCYCKVNGYLKELIGILAGNFDYVVIDGEAGIEQVNRRVMEKVTHLVLVSDASRKGLQVVSTIHEVASRMVMFTHCGLIINRAPAGTEHMITPPEGIKLLAVIPDDRTMALSDMRGESVFGLDEGCEVVKGVKQALTNLGIVS